MQNPASTQRPSLALLFITLVAALLSACVHFPTHPQLVALASAPSGAILIHDVRLFRGTSTSAQEHMDVLISAGRISDVHAIDEGARTPPPPDVQLIDGRGLTLLPGLIDLHAHLTMVATPPWYLTTPQPAHNAEAHIYSGVTTLLDAGGDPDAILALQKKIVGHAQVGPRIYFAGQLLTAPGGYPLNMIALYGKLATWSLEGSHVRGLTTVAQVEAEVDRLHELGASFIKLAIATVPPSGSPRLTDEQIAAAVKRAHGHGQRVLAHIDSIADALLCARLGVDLLAHGIEASAVTDAEANELAASGIRMEPTLVNWERFDEIVSGHYVGSQLERETQPVGIIDSFNDAELAAHRNLLAGSAFESWAVELKTYQAQRAINLMKLRAAGVPIYVGSDSQGSIATFPGSLHDELKLQVEAGIPAGEVLLAATGRAAAFLDPHAEFGTIETGKLADLLLVRGNPLEQISSTRDIAQVYIRGVAVERTPPK